MNARQGTLLLTWVMWYHIFGVGPGARDSTEKWSPLRTYETRESCEGSATRRAEAVASNLRRQVPGRTVEVTGAMADIVDPDGAHFIAAYMCYPDTFDPRASKGTGR